MLFIVPDLNASDEKTRQSPEKINSESVVNVELDLDDAPFLEEPQTEPEQKQETLPAQTTEPKTEAAPPKLSFKDKLRALLKNKKVLIALAAALILFIGGGLTAKIFLFPSEEKPQAAPQKDPKKTEPRRIVVATTPVEGPGPQAPAFLINWDPFWVPLRGAEGETLFLVCEFSIPTDDPVVNAEIQAKMVTLRDAVYYYLTHKPFNAILDKNNAQNIRDEIAKVLNENLTAGKIKNIYLKDYYTTDS